MARGRSAGASGEITWRRGAVLCARALRRRCPACGQGSMWRGWIRLRPMCPVCGLRFDRGESDFFIGAYLFNLIAAELVFAAVFVAAVLVTWPTPPWTALTWSAVVGLLVVPVLLYPYTHGIWLAVDLLFRPERHGEEI